MATGENPALEGMKWPSMDSNCEDVARQGQMDILPNDEPPAHSTEYFALVKRIEKMLEDGESPRAIINYLMIRQAKVLVHLEKQHTFFRRLSGLLGADTRTSRCGRIIEEAADGFGYAMTFLQGDREEVEV